MASNRAAAMIRSQLWSLFQPPWPGAVCFGLLMAAAVAGPLLVWPWAQESFVLPKEALFAVVALGMGAAMLAGAALGSPLRVPLHPVNAVLAAWLLWSLLSVLWAEPRPLAWDAVRRTGVFVLFAWGTQAALLDERRRVLALGAAVVATAVVVALWALWLDFDGAFRSAVPTEFRRLSDWREYPSRAGLGNTGHVADFLALGFLCALGVWLSTPWRWARWAAIGSLWILAAGMVVCWSVHSNLGLVLGSIVLWFALRDWLPEDRLRARMRRGLPVLAAGWIVVVLFFVVDHPANPHGSAVWAAEPTQSGGIFAQAFASERWREGGPTRLAIWLGTLEIIRQNPVLGAGAGTFTWQYPAAISPIAASSDELAMYSGAWTNAAHNTVLQFWAELGIPGVVIVVMLFGAGWMGILRRRDQATLGNSVVLAVAMAMLASWAASAMMSFPMQLPVSTAALMVLVVLPACLAPKGREAESMRMPASRDIPGGTAWVVMENLARPIEAGFEMRGPMALRFAAAAAVVALACLLGWHSTARVRADVLYRPVYEDWSGRTTVPRDPERMIARARASLAVSGAVHDARSAMVDYLLRLGRHEEALEELDLLERRLNAITVPLRRAAALDALGRGDEAVVHWAEVFRRNPRLAGQFPAEAARVAERFPELWSDEP